MASRCRALSRPAINLFKSTMNKQSSIPTSSFHVPRPFPTLSRPLPQMGCLQSLLPLHTAVSSARLTSCLGIDSKGSRSLSQGYMATQMQTGKAVLLLGDELSDTTFILVQIASPGIQETKYSGKIELRLNIGLWRLLQLK